MFDWLPDWMKLSQITYDHPERLALLAAIPLLFFVYLLLLRLRNRKAMRFTNTSVLGKVAPRQRRWMRVTAVILSLLTLTTLSVAFAIPQGKDRVPRERATVVMVLDVSMSMEATDVGPNRFDSMKTAAKEFVSGLPEGYNVAVVSLSGNPATRLPPTNDHGAADRAIDNLKLQDGTAIGDALYAAIDAVGMAPKGSDGSVAPAAIVLLSDGGNMLGRSPLQAAQAAKAKNIKVYTLAYGTSTGYVDLDGKREAVPPDPELMQQIASTSGGQAYTARDAGQLKSAYQQLRSSVGYEEVATEVTANWAGLGVVFGILAAVAAVMMAARWP